MAGSINKVIIVGNIGKDIELRRTPSGAAVCELAIATTERFKGKDGTRQESTEWHTAILWNQQAENAAQYLRKGSSVYVEGSLKTRSWEDQNGQKRYKTEIQARDVQYLDKVGESQQAPPQAPAASAPPMTAPAMPPIDDDLPF